MPDSTAGARTVAPASGPPVPPGPPVPSGPPVAPGPPVPPGSPVPRWRRPAGSAGAVAALGVAALSAGVYLALAATRAADMWWLGDLAVYRAGGRAVADGTDLYAMTVGRARLPFTYTPWAALCFTPLGFVPKAVLGCVWTVLSLGCLAACAWLAWRMAGLRGRRALTAAAVTAAVLLWTDPVQETLRFGQINLVLMLVVLYDLSRPDGARTKGAGIGLAAALKLTPAIFVVHLLLTGRRRAAAVATAFAAGGTALAAVLLPGASRRYWGGLFLDDARVGNVAFPGNQSVRGLLARLTHDPAVPAHLWVPVTLAVAVTGLAVAAAAYRRLGGGPGELAGGCAAALTGLLVSPISWTHHWVWIVPGIVALAAPAARAPARRAWAPALAVAVMLAPPSRRPEIDTFVPTGIVWHVPYGDGRELRLGVTGSLVSGTWVLTASAALLAAAVLLLARRRAAPPAGPSSVPSSGPSPVASPVTSPVPSSGFSGSPGSSGSSGSSGASAAPSPVPSSDPPGPAPAVQVPPDAAGSVPIS